MLNDEKTGVNLEIDDVRADKFIVKTENGKLNIYDPASYNSLDSNSAWNNSIGIWLRDSSHNRIYNNIFNNTINFKIENSMNQWNITRTKDPSIIEGPYVGGNVWVNPNGTGASQTCEDGNDDGICDSFYALDGNNTDYLPLTPPAIPAVTTKSPPTEKAAGFEAVLVIITFSVIAYIFWRKKR
jgi:parallel beta-helix repeat protein